MIDRLRASGMGLDGDGRSSSAWPSSKIGGAGGIPTPIDFLEIFLEDRPPRKILPELGVPGDTEKAPGVGGDDVTCKDLLPVFGVVLGEGCTCSDLRK